MAGADGATVLVDGLVFPESPRWHEDRVWFVDMFADRVLSTDLDGNVRTEAEFDDHTSGLGFLPDGTPLVVLRRSRQIVRLEADGPRVHADLTAIPSTWLNDMVVDGTGRAWVDSVVRPGSGEPGADCIVVVEPDGSHRVAAADLVGPNGLVITPEGDELICANTRQHRLTTFAIEPDGALVAPRVFAETGEARPDGICLDAQGAVWFGGLDSFRFQRVGDGGEVIDRIDTGGRWAVACILGGPDRRTLFMATAVTTRERLLGDAEPKAEGFIEMATVDVPGAGWP
jgi:sugar lactone lactonase YvrE